MGLCTYRFGPRTLLGPVGIPRRCQKTTAILVPVSLTYLNRVLENPSLSTDTKRILKTRKRRNDLRQYLSNTPKYSRKVDRFRGKIVKGRAGEGSLRTALSKKKKN